MFVFVSGVKCLRSLQFYTSQIIYGRQKFKTSRLRHRPEGAKLAIGFVTATV